MYRKYDNSLPQNISYISDPVKLVLLLTILTPTLLSLIAKLLVALLSTRSFGVCLLYTSRCV